MSSLSCLPSCAFPLMPSLLCLPSHAFPLISSLSCVPSHVFSLMSFLSCLPSCLPSHVFPLMSSLSLQYSTAQVMSSHYANPTSHSVLALTIDCCMRSRLRVPCLQKHIRSSNTFRLHTSYSTRGCTLTLELHLLEALMPLHSMIGAIMLPHKCQRIWATSLTLTAHRDGNSLPALPDE